MKRKHVSLDSIYGLHKCGLDLYNMQATEKKRIILLHCMVFLAFASVYYSKLFHEFNRDYFDVIQYSSS